MENSRKKSLSELSWEARFVETLPGDPESRNFVREVRQACYSEVKPTPVSQPTLLAWSEPLAADLGLERPQPGFEVALLSGNQLAPGMRPYAARYGGHQFGHWAGQLGDGRAITLGEARIDPQHALEFQLKGAGRTPYSRSGDGRAVLRSSLREFLCSEAMHFLGVPTTRALSLVATGDNVIRDMFYDGHPRAEPGAIVCRVAPSFLRFGNFEILAARGEHQLLAQLANFLIAEHYPELKSIAPGPELYALLFDEIARRTALLLVHWMRVGFVHGVMNTDNLSVLGLTIDYGPYGWLEPFDPRWTPNTTDAQGRRYCFGNQANIAFWNLARLAEALLPLIESEERAGQGLELYRHTFTASYASMLAQKLGLSSLEFADANFIPDLFRLMASVETDYTIFFRSLSSWRDGDFLETIEPAFYQADTLTSSLRAEWLQWSKRYAAQLSQQGTSHQERQSAMNRVNPKYVPRNYLAQIAIEAAEKGDMSYLERLMRVLETPYDELPDDNDLAARRPEWARSAPGCSALSCSS